MQNNLEFHAHAGYVISDNKRILDEADFTAKYDGKKMDIIGNKDDKVILMQLTKDELMDLLAIPSSEETIEERLITDFPIKKRRSLSRKETRRQKKKKGKTTTRRKTTTRKRKRTRSRRHIKSKNTEPTITKLMGELD